MPQQKDLELPLNHRITCSFGNFRLWCSALSTNVSVKTASCKLLVGHLLLILYHIQFTIVLANCVKSVDMYFTFPVCVISQNTTFK